MTLVSILTPAYKPDFFADALRSALAQTHDDFEHVICDDCPGDEVAAIVREVAGDDPRVRYVRNAEDIGQIENFNLAFRESRGEYLRWMGADDWLEPSYARLCAAALDALRQASLGRENTIEPMLAPAGEM